MTDILHNIFRRKALMRLLLFAVTLNVQFSIFNLHAQTTTSEPEFKITIGGNVYGGGNEGNTEGNTNVTIRTGQIKNVFGGARMADVDGRAYVNIDGEHGSGVILISAVYGGNDIAGTVGKEVNPNDTLVDKVPTGLKDVLKKGNPGNPDTETSKKNVINNSWVAFVQSSPRSTENDKNCILVGSVFGGGNGDYDYFAPGDSIGKDASNNKITATEYLIRDKVTGDSIAHGNAPYTRPELTKTYLEINGGCLSQVYGGGNNATVTVNTTISMNNPSKGLQELFPAQGENESDEAYQSRLMQQLVFLSTYTGITTFQGSYTSLDYTSSRVFGGNNKAEMKIRPTWNLQRGKLRDLYSGGNEGNMTHPEGLILDIKPLAANNDYLSIVNVYGGCRRADVRPTDNNGNPIQNSALIQLPTDLGYRFPSGLPARTVVHGGKVTNVYGGNDISGHVFGGNAVGIYATVYGDVYGGGNGSYSYTDKPELGALPTFRDYYYNPDEVQAKEREYSGNSNFTLNPDYKSVEALNVFRPNAEQVSILVKGTENNPTIIRGSLYLGGNSASLRTEGSTILSGTTPKVELKIGSYSIIDKVFLGNNGANMVTEDILKLYAGNVNMATGVYDPDGVDFSNMAVLTDETRFAKYMEGCAMSIHPSVVFEDEDEYGDPETYIDYTCQIGSFYCGGNVGSMTWPGTNTINFDKKVIIFDKFVGGCNRANVAAREGINAKYLGGMIGSAEEQQPGGMLEDPTDPDSPIKDCLILNFTGLKMRPHRWIQDADGNDILDSYGNPQLEWNTFDYVSGDDVDADPDFTGTITRTDNEDDFNRRLRGGNVYGGCYESGHMNGNVVINLIDDIVDLTGDYAVFDIVEKDNAILYENDEYTVTKRYSGVILDEQGMDPLGLAMNVFGGGYGKDSEVWGSATVNLRAGHTFQIFGGGQQGPIGKSLEDSGVTSFDESDYVFNSKHYQYDARYSTYVNMEDDDHIAGTATNNIPETQFIYGGSFEAPIMGNTHIYLGNGRIFNSFAGSCNADILGHTETYVGKGINKDGSNTDGQIINAFPYIIDHIYGGNDLGGKILGEKRAELYPSADDALQALADCDFTTRVGTTNGQDLTKVYGYNSESNTNPSVLKASAYIEYTAGHVLNIFGGAYGDYDYTESKYRAYCDKYGRNNIYYDENNVEIGRFSKPRLGNAFINFKPIASNNELTNVNEIYGAGQGQHYVIDRDSMQERSYILIDIPQTITTFQNTVVFGAGAFGGVGMEIDSTSVAANPDKASAVIDLFRGQIRNVFGGSYEEGVTRRTVVNVPTGSTIAANNIFGGAYGLDSRYPCDVYESNVNYKSGDAQAAGGLYGGNNNARRTIYANVNVTAPVWTNKSAGFQATVYGAGLGQATWAEYTNVTIGNGGVVYKAFGGGNAGEVLNLKSVLEKKRLADADTVPAKKGMDIKIGGNYNNCELHNARHIPFSEMATDIEAGITRDFYHKKEKYNTNVHILTGGLVTGYAYGGGFGETATVSGTTYVDVLGGTVDRDIYGGGQGGSVRDLYGLETFTAQTNAYVKSGMVRNAYGGGYLGSIGYHDATTTASTNDLFARTNVVIGATPASNAGFANGIPAITRNAYGGGEGGSIFGSAHITMNNGYIGYRYTYVPIPTGTELTTDTEYYTLDTNGNYTKHTVGESSDGESSGGDTTGDETQDETPLIANGSNYYQLDYVEELDDPGLGEEAATNAIVRAGCVFGGGYIANSYTDSTYVYMYGGHLRTSLFGGGEVGPIGRGTKRDATGNEVDMPTIYMGGATHVYLYGGHVHRDVFGGGRGYDSWGSDGTKFMSQAQIDASEFFIKGFVFGSTDVNIRGGIVGTSEGLAEGHGNVFGGGDVGFVYSAIGQKVGEDPNTLSTENGLPVDGGGYYYIDGDIESGMSEDCKVDVAPYCLVTDEDGIEFPEFVYDANGNIEQEADTEFEDLYKNKTSGTRTFAKGEYVPVDYLNTLRNKTADATNWGKLDATGIHIYNAVFAGGNVSVGSDQVFVNSNTVFGNATAALRDVYHRDLITLGTEHVGGLYGDGNLTFVDGFRELTISNYGTDFYGLSDNISLADYYDLSDRERAYFELKYECLAHCTDKNGKEYEAGATLKVDDYHELFDGTGGTDAYNNTTYWVEGGFCSIYAGRLLNTIQRADFVGVWGSRMVLQGARDRVPEKVDYTDYTINRVGEISLNRVKTQNDGDTSEEDRLHGNYFGIYNAVNYLGNLTSDVKFDAVRTTDVKEGSGNEADGTTSYYDWKVAKKGKSNRNNGTSKNMVALASGVYLEIINESTEKRTDGVTDWGYVTGVIQLDLINVMQGLGGGYVYAKNEHGVKHWHTEWSKVTLSPYNRYARTHLRFTYDPVTATDEIETSGNFIHNTKQIVDDCYPTINSFYGADASPAHYWYIKGSIYVYDQYISAYTGSATAYSQNVSIPLTITAASHGKLTLRNVQPNLYAYKDKNGNKLGSNGADATYEAGGVTYALNDPITYWDYELLSDVEKEKFVSKTYTVIEKCKIGDVAYEKGDAMLPDDYDDIKDLATQVWDVEKEEYVTDADKPATYLVRLSNNVSHETGYILTYDVDNPMPWNKYYTKSDSPSTQVNTKVYNAKNSDNQYTLANRGDYIAGPTYRLNTSTAAVYGQREYGIGDIITKPVYDIYDAIPDDKLPSGQATFEEAYVATQELIVTGDDNNEHHIYAGTPLVKSDFDGDDDDDSDDERWTAISSKVARANIVSSTMTLDETNKVYLYAGDLLTDAELATIKSTYSLTDATLSEYVAKAYYCSAAGKYGGDLYEPGTTYRAVEAWCSMSKEDRSNFFFDYDALDLLIDSIYGRSEYDKQQYDGVGSTSTIINDPTIYSRETPLDYQAKYTGEETLTYTNETGATVTIEPDEIIDREDYESIPNERYHYAPITVKNPGMYYVVRIPFLRGDQPYTAGETISADIYNALSPDQKTKVDQLYFPESKTTQKIDPETNEPMVDNQGNPVYDDVTYYYCRDSYKVNEHGEGVAVTTEGINSTSTLSTAVTYGLNQTVPLGTVISTTSYTELNNLTVQTTNTESRLVFTIIGNTPLETSTLYVSRESNIFDLSKEKVITIIYQYDYEESDESGMHITPVSEQHVLNIHLQFKSGVPEIGQLLTPPTVLPSTTVGLKVPTVTPGAYEILASGWEIFSNDQDATSHQNGQPYINNNTPMYWYQDGYWVAYYAKTYLGKTYSNSVQFSVANYHDLDKVMQDKENHMFLDHKDAHRQRDPKIYIDDRDCVSDATKNELDLLKDFFDLTMQPKQFDSETELSIPIASSGALSGHHGVDVDYIGASKNLEFILQSDLAPKAYTEWTPIGSDTKDANNKYTECFEGMLHGDGHTISGLTNSLFKSLCGEIYNLGVTGSFTSAGIVDTGTGYVENCWIQSSATTVDNTVKAVFGNPDDTEHPTSQQVVNCYYPETNAYNETSNAHGNARQMPVSAFYNGEVTYDLNGFYLNKRYFDQALTSETGMPYRYFRANADGTLPTGENQKKLPPDEKYYSADFAFYPLNVDTKLFGYVEYRYSDGDFVYAGGTIPDDKDIRFYEDTQGKGYYPIWPDDYLFFGQRLTYGYEDANERYHQSWPSYINKTNTRLTSVSVDVNRVYRAPAYFQSKDMGVAHYNPYAVFAPYKSGDPDTLAYKDMTAIDFTGYNGDVTAYPAVTASDYKRGLQSNNYFFPPLLDNDGLESLRNAGLTRNWLVYTPAATENETDADSKTYDVVTTYLSEPAYRETNTNYRTVAPQNTTIYGHAVVQNGTGSYVAETDHFLVDKQDFNAPTEYTFNSGKRMWYQRTPDLYVDRTKGWEDISIPFSAELVTTQQKGEITHFYESSYDYYDHKTGYQGASSSDSKVGHEYWLREFNGMLKEGGNLVLAKDEHGDEIAGVYLANFNYPDAITDGDDKPYTNTFLWDYYYQYSSNPRQDKNKDTYQQDYYASTHTFEDYGYSVAAKPYIIGFPGTTYYEFDLSGGFRAANTNSSQTLNPLAKQVITFASLTGITIAVSDDECALAAVTADGYAFTPNYLGKPMADGYYQLNSTGSSYEKVTASGTPAAFPNAVPFRPYFTTVTSGGARKHKPAESIAFTRTNASLGGGKDGSDPDEDLYGNLSIWSKRKVIFVKSDLSEETTVRIVNAAGLTVNTFTLEPGETVETRINNAGVYIVQSADSRYTKKLLVK